jgi:general secretion pathway protein E
MAGEKSVSMLERLRRRTPAGAAAEGPGRDASRDAVLADFLAREGLVDPKSVERARRVAVEGGARLEQALTQLGLLSDSGLAAALARLLDIALAAPADYPETPVLADRLRVAFLRKIRAVPLACNAATVTLAMADPRDEFALGAVAAAVGLAVERRIGLPIDIDAALDRLYGDAAPRAAGTEAALAALDGGGPDSFGDDAERLKDLASEAPVVRLVNQLIARAVETRASDIHLEPFPERLRVRYRYDGVLHEADSPQAGWQAAIVSRIKIMAGLDIAERRLPQDGRIKLAVRGHDIDFRVSTIPTLHGEKVVLRILDRSAVVLDFDSLGFRAALRDRFLKLLDAPNGIILVTGPTGSGKTTTLYTALKHLNAVTRNVVTVEDPIEYQLAGINQIQVKTQIDLSFATLLRSILRQDPDVIMIGEIRDLETAQIAVQAALTGHLVLSTLHTNSAAATVTRLRDMGVEDYLLAATLNGVLAQRLVRRLCPDCRRPVEASAELAARLELHRFGASEPVTLYEATGCARCRGTGYQGRTAVAELLVPDEAVQRLILTSGDQSALERAASAAGMRTMEECGMIEMLDGATTLRELARSIRVRD